MCYLHTLQNPIIHGDLKSPNVLLDAEGCAKISDFGLSSIVSHKRIKDSCSSKENSLAANNPLWSSPELLRGKKPSKESDVFSFGIILWELLTFKLPYDYDDSNQFELMALTYQILEDNIRPSIEKCRKKFPGKWHEALEDYIKLMKDCWKTNPYERPRFCAIKKKLEEIKSEMYPNANSTTFIQMDKIESFGEVSRHFLSDIDSHSGYNLDRSKVKRVLCYILTTCLIIVLICGVPWVACKLSLIKECRRRHDRCQYGNHHHCDTLHQSNSNKHDKLHNSHEHKDQRIGLKSTTHEKFNDADKTDSYSFMQSEDYMGSFVMNISSNNDIVPRELDGPFPEDLSSSSNDNEEITEQNASYFNAMFVLIVVLIFCGLVLYYCYCCKRRRININNKELFSSKKFKFYQKFKKTYYLDALNESCDEAKINIIEKDQREISRETGLLILNYQKKPLTEDWTYIRSLILSHFKMDACMKEYYRLTKFTLDHLVLETSEQWKEFILLLFKIPDIKSHVIWEKIYKYLFLFEN